MVLRNGKSSYSLQAVSVGDGPSWRANDLFGWVARGVLLGALVLAGGSIGSVQADDLEHPSDLLRVTNYPGGLAIAELSRWREATPEI